MKQHMNIPLLVTLLFLLAACNKEQLSGTVTNPGVNSSVSRPNDKKLVSRIYLINLPPSGPDTVTEISLNHDAAGRLTYTASKNWHNPAVAQQYVSYYYNGADTLPAAIMEYSGASLTKTVFNNYVNGLLASDSILNYNAAGVLSLVQSTVFLTATSLVKSRMVFYRISNGAPTTIFLRDSITCKVTAKDNNNNLLSFTTARNDSPFPSFTNGMLQHTNTFDTGINPMYHYFRHGNTALDPISPEYESGVLKLLAATPHSTSSVPGSVK